MMLYTCVNVDRLLHECQIMSLSEIYISCPKSKVSDLGLGPFWDPEVCLALNCSIIDSFTSNLIWCHDLRIPLPEKIVLGSYYPDRHDSGTQHARYYPS